MGNTASLVKNNESNEDGRSEVPVEAKEVPTFKMVLDELKDKTVTNDHLEYLFKKCCFMEVENFFDKYPSDDTLKCQYETRSKPAWFFICNSCTTLENSCICPSCFFNGPHIEQKHKFSIYESTSAVCDCGNAESVKPSGFCVDHRNVDEANQVKQCRMVQPTVQKDLHLFFRYLFAYLQRVTTMPSDFEANKPNIEVIIEWLSFLASRSSILIHIISEETSSRTLDPSNFNLNNPTPLPFPTTENHSIESHHFLPYIFRRPHLLNYFLDLLTLLIDNHRLFKIIFFEEYLKNYVDIFTPRDPVSTEMMLLIGSFYMETKSILIPFSTGYSSNNNYMELLLQTHKTYMPILEPFYKSDKPIEREVMLQSDFTSFPKLIKNKEVALYFMNDKKIFKLFFEFALALHNFISPQFVDPTITTTCFLVSLEHRLMQSTKNIISTLHDDPTVPKKIITETIAQLKKLVYPQLYLRNELLLPHQDFFQKFKYSEIPVHFPLYRMLATAILEGNYNMVHELADFGVEEVVNMVNTILLFRVCYISYDPSFDPKESLMNLRQSTEFFTDITMMNDLFALQMGLMSLGPRHFIHAFFNVITSVDVYNTSSAFNELFALLISSFQVRGTINPTDAEIRHHLIQVISAGFFVFDNFNLGFIFKDVPKEKIEEIVNQVSVKKDKVRELKDEYWKDIDLYYPFLSLKFKTFLKSKTIMNYGNYQKRAKLPDEFPAPPKLTPLHPEFVKVDNIYNEPTLFEVIFTVILDFLEHDYVSYDDAFDLQTVIRLLLKKTDIVVNDFLYMLCLGINSFKEAMETMDKPTLDYLHETINAFFAAEDKTQVKFERNFSVLNLIKTYNVEVTVGVKKPLSLLDLLCNIWVSTKQSLNLEKKTLLKHVFQFLNQFNANFKDFFEKAGIDFNQNQLSAEEINQKKAVSERAKKISERMKQQQQSFLNDLEKEDTDSNNNNNSPLPTSPSLAIPGASSSGDVTPDVANSPSPAVPSPTLPPPNRFKEIVEGEEHNHEEVNHDESCIVCQTGKEQELLYSIGYIDITSTVQLHNKLEVEKYIADPTLPDDYVTFLEEYFFSEINPGSLPYLPSKDDDPTLFACFLFYRSASTYITSCSHNIHQTCLRKLFPNFEEGFSCPLCSLSSNIIIPLSVDNTIESLEARKLFFTSLCRFDFFLFNKENVTVIERYLWKFVLQNAETLELKSRKTSYYSNEPYFLMKQVEFNKELATLKRLFNVVMACNVPTTPENRLPLENNYIFLMDPFIASTYQVFLSNCDPFNCIVNGYIYYVFSIILVHFMRTRPDEILNKKNLKEFIAELKSTTMSNELIEQFNDQIHPYLRKMYLFREFYIPDNKSEISLEDFSDFNKIRDYLGVKPIDKFMAAMDFTPLIDHYVTLQSTPKGSKFVGVFPPPSSFKRLPKFINLPEKYIDFLTNSLEYGHCDNCKSLKKTVCMFCSLGFCATENCKGSAYIHSYRCPNTPLGMFMGVDNPLVKVLKEEHGKTTNFFPFGIYLSPDGVASLTPDCSLTLSQKKLKSLYKHWMNSNNSRKFN
ncbi:RING zinc finger-containing protein [Heterostelium album PN500]|uniref:E3 ubiquitin-protein ligase n=1 Tax=Heterostelium pallidum (strain ATCC 26659 / Pp 5 / PN500) TaxID=670386 RepID=D3BBX2_HETP5|nr:RING zinc finger-containing protein [Heterostelium album PN500]EFA81155.1 RING zinc finger-containing protein [Heterostelium album PN500]|eukprot:XP_020433273.1 RING zinc finger-containing protein [Heterostelium album PN500]